MRELPGRAITQTAVRIWRALPGEGSTCEFFERMHGDEPRLYHAPVGGSDDLWWLALPIEPVKYPEELGGRTPAMGELVCDRCLAHAVYLVAQSWEEANL